MTTRPAGKAGSWYEAAPDELQDELKQYLAAVPDSFDGKTVPIEGARVVIAPHAGYTYSGPCAAWAYKTLDLSRAKRVFVLGPSHTYFLDGCAVTGFDKWETPFGDLTVDKQTLHAVKEAAGMDSMPTRNDQKEHSLEMHMPYLHLRCQETFASPDQYPSIVPLLIGSNDEQAEKQVGRALLPYFRDPENAFVISSDFCHWGDHFRYTPYSPSSDPKSLKMLRASGSRPEGNPIHETIRAVDEAAMDAVKSGDHAAFVRNISETGNTVCGQHPIGVAMAALELLAKEHGFEDKGRFRVIQYDRSNLVEKPTDFSVSYVSAYAII